jgi:hypothetical protein
LRLKDGSALQIDAMEQGRPVKNIETRIEAQG